MMRSRENQGHAKILFASAEASPLSAKFTLRCEIAHFSSSLPENKTEFGIVLGNFQLSEMMSLIKVGCQLKKRKKKSQKLAENRTWDQVEKPA